MRTFLSLVLFFQMSLAGICSDKVEDIKLIRRAYLDVVGVLPTVEEVEWYTVYTNGGYGMAVDFLLRDKPKQTQELLTKWLTSESYKTDNSRQLTIEDIMGVFLFLAGKKVGDVSFSESKQLLADSAVLCSSSTSETIDYICNALLCRDSNLEEANIIEKYIRNCSSEEGMWLGVVELVITFNTFLYK